MVKTLSRGQKAAATRKANKERAAATAAAAKGTASVSELLPPTAGRPGRTTTAPAVKPMFSDKDDAKAAIAADLTPEETEVPFVTAPEDTHLTPEPEPVKDEKPALSDEENARLFGLLNLALADGYIGAGEAKFHFNFWRPVTAIHSGDTDTNLDTAGDVTWTPLQANYPTPDHPLRCTPNVR